MQEHRTDQIASTEYAEHSNGVACTGHSHKGHRTDVCCHGDLCVVYVGPNGGADDGDDDDDDDNVGDDEFTSSLRRRRRWGGEEVGN